MSPSGDGPQARATEQPLRILRLALNIGETSAPYKQFTLGAAHRHAVTLCVLAPPNTRPPDGIRVFAGDGTFGGYRRALRTALAAGEYDAVHAHSPHVALAWLLTRPAIGRRLRAVYTFHSSYPNYSLRNRALLCPVFAGFERIVCCSHASRDSLPAPLRWLAGKRLTVIPNGANFEEMDRSLAGHTPRQTPSRRFTLGVVGRLVPVKNPVLAVEAFALSAVADSDLVFIGEGELRSAVQAAATDPRIGQAGGRVLMTGLIPREEVWRRLSETDLLVSTSRVEGLPIAVLEAMACGCPVILSDIPSHREVAAGVESIPLIPPDDAAGFAAQIRRFRTMSAEERHTIGELCARHVRSRFTLDRMLTAYDQVFAALCRRPLPQQRENA